MTFSALVVGLGQIGMGYDLKLDPDSYVLTHARAFQRHPAFRLAGAVDVDESKRRAFELQYGVPAFPDVEAASAALRPDVVAVATPTPLHAASVRAVLKAGRPTAVLCEKPLAYDLDEAREILDSATAQGCKLFANYMRRSEPGVIEVKARLDDGRMGPPVKGVVWYSKGLFNNGSHFLNLLQYWFGDITDFQIVQRGRLWDGIDPEPDVVVSFGELRIIFLAAREENFSHYTIELISPNGRLRYEKGGEQILWQGTAGDEAFAGYTILDADEESIAVDFERVQWHVADQLAASLKGGKANLCSGTEALRTIEVLTAIKAKL